ncbi:MAG: hypothetical protein FJ301_07170 [Planctomycetes bacterium]|nr:hypothetical protein [Planctomycetota bacterium]
MLPPTPAAQARKSLRRIALPHALDFGARLLSRGEAGIIGFREFVAVARAFVAERPEDSAVYLATLVALDINRVEGELAQPDRSPSTN